MICGASVAAGVSFTYFSARATTSVQAWMTLGLSRMYLSVAVNTV